MAAFHIEIVTPKGVLYSGEVDGFQAPGIRGRFGVLPRHIPYITALSVGEFRVDEGEGGRRRLSVSGGFLEVLRTGIKVVVEGVEFAEDIEVSRAEAARDRARERLSRRRHPDVDVARAEAALARALNRLQVAERGGMDSG